MSYPPQPNNQEPLYPQAQPSSPYFQPQGPTGPGYGQPSYPPPQQPYPGYVPPVPQYYPQSQQPYQNMPPQPGYQPSVVLVAAPPAPQRSNAGLIITLVIVAALVIGGVLHYGVFSPASVVKLYLQDLVQNNGTAAYSLLCTSQHNSNLDTLFNQLSQANNTSVSFDISSAQYVTSNWGLTSATVHLGGSISGTSNGTTSSLFLNEDFPTAASGLGWCIDTSNTGTLGLQHSHT